MRIIKHREIRTTTLRQREFCYTDAPSAGAAFACTEDGTVYVESLNEAAAENYRRCIERVAQGEMVDLGVRITSWDYIEPAVGECVCGNHVWLTGFTNTCEKCDRDYNNSGQLLAPREQWGEETGETAADIININ
jgi:hypothetical protein